MIPKRWRIKFFNWLGAGKITITYEKPQEYNLMSTYTMAGGLGYSNGSGMLNISGVNSPSTGQTLTLKITPANGGHIVTVNSIDHQNESLYIISDDADFDRELGKIVTVSRLKA